MMSEILVAQGGDIEIAEKVMIDDYSHEEKDSFQADTQEDSHGILEMDEGEPEVTQVNTEEDEEDQLADAQNDIEFEDLVGENDEDLEETSE